MRGNSLSNGPICLELNTYVDEINFIDLHTHVHVLCINGLSAYTHILMDKGSGRAGPGLVLP